MTAFTFSIGSYTNTPKSHFNINNPLRPYIHLFADIVGYGALLQLLFIPMTIAMMIIGFYMVRQFNKQSTDVIPVSRKLVTISLVLVPLLFIYHLSFYIGWLGWLFS